MIAIAAQTGYMHKVDEIEPVAMHSVESARPEHGVEVCQLTGSRNKIDEVIGFLAGGVD